MTEFLAVFLTWQFLVLCIGIAAVTFVFRTTIEYFILNNPKLPGNSSSRFWREFVLVILPILLGVVFPIFAHKFPYPEAIADTSSKFLFGSSAGLLSPTLYRVIKALLWKNVSDNTQIAEQFPIVNKIQEVVNNDVKNNTADDINPDEPKI